MGKIKELVLKGRSDALLTSRKGSNAQVTPGKGSSSAKSRKRSDRVWDRSRFLALMRRLLAAGAPSEGRSVQWNLSAASRYPCVDPVHVGSIHGFDLRPDPKGVRGEVVWKRNVWGEWYARMHWSGGQVRRPIGVVQVFARCRKCEGCALHHRNIWIARTIVEARAAPARIWFVTLTSGGDHREYVDRLAAVEASRTRVNFYALTERERFPYRATVVKREVASYNKRLRKGYGPNARCSFRFVAVTEPHKDGHAHAHVIYFEGAVPLTERLFRARWRPRGMAQAELVQGADRVAAYVSKYITKDFAGTVHASLAFGRPRPE